MNEIIIFNLPIHVIIAVIVSIIIFTKGIFDNIEEAKEYGEPISADWYVLAIVFLLIWGGFFWW